MRYIFCLSVLLFLSAASAADKPKFGPDGLRIVQNFTVLPEVRPQGMRDVDSFSPEDFSFVKRSLAKEPKYKSKNPRYTIFVLGDDNKSVMTVVWDESKGDGTGHDLLYADRNQNGDLTDDGDPAVLFKKEEKSKFLNLQVLNVDECEGKRQFDFNLELAEPLKFTFRCKVNVRLDGQALYKVGLVPGPTELHHASSITEAPVYRIGGAAIPSLHEKHKRKRLKALPGQAVLPRKAGDAVKYVLSLAQYGDRPEVNLRFINAAFPGVDEGVRDVNIWGHAKQVKGAAYPLGIFQQLDKDGKVTREVVMQPGCACGGGHNQQVNIPENTPAGMHRIAIRIYGKSIVGGLAEYHYPIEISAAKGAN